MNQATDNIDKFVAENGHLPPALPTYKVFVYGTLKKGYHNHQGYLEGAQYLGEGYIEGILFHCGGFPALSLADRFTFIRGEIYEVSDKQLARMDQLEGHPDWYSRVQVYVNSYGLVWVYTYPRTFAVKESQVIQCGEWKGQGTPSVHWLGMNKGVSVGTFSALPELDTIRVGKGDRFILVRNLTKNTYDHIDKATGAFLGSYKHLGDMEGRDGKVKPILRLPAVSKPVISHIVREHMSADGKVQVSNVPVPYNPPPSRTPVIEMNPPHTRNGYWTPAEVETRQAEKLKERIEAMGLKVRRA